MLKIETGKLDQIERGRSTNTITQIVRSWFDMTNMDPKDRWEELGRVLLEPAVSEPTIARSLQPHLRRGSSVDSAISMMSSLGSSIDSIGPYQMSYVGKLLSRGK